MADNVIELTDATFDEVVHGSDEPVLVDFWAPWCGPCKMMSPIMEEIAEEYAEKSKICKLNTDDARDHLDGVLARDVTHEIRASERRDVVEQLSDRWSDQLALPSIERGRAEGFRDQRPVLRVLVAVEANEVLAHVLAHRLVGDPRGEGVRIAQDGLDRVVAENQRGRTSELLDLPDRTLLAPLRPVGMWIAHFLDLVAPVALDLHETSVVRSAGQRLF